MRALCCLYSSFQVFNQWNDLQELGYQCYVFGGNTYAVLFA
jgi:hypothetical protein